MPPTSLPALSPLTPLATLARRLDAWRSTKTHGQRIPTELWNAAAALARVHGLSRTSAVLRLSYYDLRTRLVPGSKPGGKAAPPTFIELPVPTARSGTAERATLELTRPCGSRLTLGLSDARPEDLLPLVEAFLRS